MQAAVKAAQSGDIIDVGPGSFAGAKLDKGLVIQGANATYDIARWDVPTIITSPLNFTSSASGAILTIVGLQFGEVSPISGSAPGANITIYNCKFFGSKPIVTTGLQWAELYVTASIFEARPVGSKTATAATAISGGDVGVAVIRENVFRGFIRSAIDCAGPGQIIRVSYNEFTGCNASADPSQAAVRIDASKIEQEITVEKSLFIACAGSVAIAGNIAGKTAAVQYNSFRETPRSSVAIRNTSPEPLTATCNAFNVPTTDREKPLAADAIAKSIRQLVRGPVMFSPANLDARDVHTDAIGYEPDAAAACASVIAE